MKKRILFVCIGNACRSIMAEALTRHYWNGRYESASAGINPLGRVSEGTLEVLREIDVSADNLQSKGIVEIDLSRFDCIINLSEYPLEQFVPKRYHVKIINWYVRDPYGQSLDAYRRTRDAIEWLVTEKVPEWMGDNSHNES
ncbi:MAG: low molecular weight phosphatase family protein [Desulfoferrobacter sp.]